METWVCVGWVLIRNGDGLCVGCWVGADQKWRWSVCCVGADQPWKWNVCCVRWRHGRVLASNGDMGVCWVGADQKWRWRVCLVGADQQWRWNACWVGNDHPWRCNACCVGADCSQHWRHGCVLVGCSSTMETWVCASWVLTSNGDMGVCLFVAEQQRTHE